MGDDALLDAPPEEAAKWRFVRRRAHAAFAAHGYHEVQPAPLEPAGTAARLGLRALTLGDGSELRADGVASIARLYAADAAAPPFARWMTAGNVYEPPPHRPHRYSAWHATCGVIFGAGDPAADAEVAALARTFADDVGLRSAEVVIGTLGDPPDVQRWLEATAEVRQLACAICQGQPDPLAFLSCDDEGCRALAASAPPLRDTVGVAALKHHESVLLTLETSGFKVADDPGLAFGASAYDRTLVEVRAKLPSGERLVIARGGRRDRLVGTFGGRPTPAVGISFGIARLARCLPSDGVTYEPPCELLIAARGAAARAWALQTAAAERARGFRVDVDLREVGWADQLRRAEEVRARFVIVVSDVERKKHEVVIRNMATREVRHVPEDRLSSELKRLLR